MSLERRPQQVAQEVEVGVAVDPLLWKMAAVLLRCLRILLVWLKEMGVVELVRRVVRVVAVVGVQQKPVDK